MQRVDSKFNSSILTASIYHVLVSVLTLVVAVTELIQLAYKVGYIIIVEPHDSELSFPVVNRRL